MDRHPRILEQRVQPAAVGRNVPGGNIRNGPRITVTSPSMTSGRLRKNIAGVMSACLHAHQDQAERAVSSAHSMNVPSCPPQNAA